MHTPEQELVDQIPDLDPGDAHILKMFGGVPEEQGEFDPAEEEPYIADEEEETSIELDEELTDEEFINKQLGPEGDADAENT